MIKLKDLFRREIKAVDKQNIYTNGVDNNYPQRMELLIDNSVTAKMSANKMADFIIGKGFKDKRLNDFIVDAKKKLTAYDLLKLSARSIAYQKGFYWHIGYNGIGDVNRVYLLPYKNCRLSKSDDFGGESEIYYSDNWSSEAFTFSKKKNKKKWFHPFSNDKDVVLKRMYHNEKATAENFRGEVLFTSLEAEYIYPKSYVDSVRNDADNEYQSSVFRNNNLRNQFVQKTLIVTKAQNNTEDGVNKDSSNLEDAIVSMAGAEGSNLAILEVDDVGKVKDFIDKIELGTEVNDQVYKYYDMISESNILKAWNNIPKALVLSDNTLFGQNAESLKEMKRFYHEELSEEINSVVSAFKKVYPMYNWEIEPLIELEQQAKGLSDIELKKLESQSELKGSVGGVTALLDIQKSVTSGTTTKESAIAMIEEIYGIPREKALEMLGDPIELSEEEAKELITKDGTATD